MAYWSEKQRVANYSISDEEVKPYLPLPQVSEHTPLFDDASRDNIVTIIARYFSVATFVSGLRSLN